MNKNLLRFPDRRCANTTLCCTLGIILSWAFMGSAGCQAPVDAPGNDGGSGGDGSGGNGSGGGGNDGGGASGGDPVAIGQLAAITNGPAGNLIGVDITNDTVVNIDRTTGAATLISGNGAGSGPEIDAPNRVFRDTDGSLLVTTLARLIYRVDPDSGNRTLLLDASDENDPFPDSFTGIATAANGDIIVINVNAAPFIALVDEAAGALTDVAAANVTNGAEEIKPGNGNAVIIIDSFRRAVVQVDVTTGEETILSNVDTAAGPVDTEVGMGSDFGQPRVLAVTDTGTIYVADEGNSSFGLGTPAIFEISSTTGNRTVIAAPDTGEGPAVGRPQSMVIDDEGLLVLIDATHTGLLIVDPKTAVRALLAIN